MSFSRKANRAAARAAGLLKNPSGTPEDRMHLLNSNMGRLRELHTRVPADHVLVICDTRDPMARTLVTAGRGQGQISQHVMDSAMRRVIPTVFLALPTNFVADVTSFFSPGVSETLECHTPTWRYVMVIAGGGTLLHEVNLEAAS